MEVLKKGSRGQNVRLLQKLLDLYVDGNFGELTEETVKTFQKEHGIDADGIVGIRTWKELLPLQYQKSSRKITEIIVHCTATPEGRDYTVEQIRKQHKAQGWSDIGYHYVIYRDGSVVPGRSVNIAGAHCQGHNAHSIGVCYVGGCDKDMKPKDTRTAEQKDALVKTLKALRFIYPEATIHGHYEFANKACPSFKVTEYSKL